MCVMKHDYTFFPVNIRNQSDNRGIHNQSDSISRELFFVLERKTRGELRLAMSVS